MMPPGHQVFFAPGDAADTGLPFDIKLYYIRMTLHLINKKRTIYHGH
jgi:hypothetical protein